MNLQRRLSMKKKNSILLVVLVVALMVMSPAWVPQDGKRDIQAVLIKVINNVEKKEPTKGFTKAVTTDQLKSGYEIKTAAKSIAVIKFNDNSKLRSEEHTSNSSHSQISYAVFCLKKKKYFFLLIAFADCRCCFGNRVAPAAPR